MLSYKVFIFQFFKEEDFLQVWKIVSNDFGRYFVYYALLMTFPWLGMRSIHQQLSLSPSLTFLHEKFTRSDEIICAASSFLLFIINQLALESNLLTTTTTNLG